MDELADAMFGKPTHEQELLHLVSLGHGQGLCEYLLERINLQVAVGE